MKILVDARVFITLAEIDAVYLLNELDGDIVMPELVAVEIQDEPARTELNDVRGDWMDTKSAEEEALKEAMNRLGRQTEPRGDAAVLAFALEYDESVVVTDDKPLRNTCKTLGISLSGSVGVVVASVEKDVLSPEDAKESLIRMDEVGGRFSASLLRKAERLIENAD
jgi:predicted nucleic acid-binding protein